MLDLALPMMVGLAVPGLVLGVGVGRRRGRWAGAVKFGLALGLGPALAAYVLFELTVGLGLGP